MKKILLAVIVIVIVILVVLGVSKNQKMPAETDPITIGISAPLTGPVAEFGEAFRDGVLMAIEDLDAEKKGFKFVFEDNAYSAKQEISVLQKFKDIDKVDLVLSWGTTPAEGGAPIIETLGVPYFPSATQPKITRESKYIIRNYSSLDDAAQIYWEYFQAQEFKKVGIVALNIDYFNTYTTSLEKFVAEGKSIEVIDKVNNASDVDFRTTLQKIKSSSESYDVIAVLLLPGQISSFYKQMAELEIEIPTVGTDFFESPAEIAASGSAIDGAVYINIASNPEFDREIDERFNLTNQISTAANAYDMVDMIVNKYDFTDSESLLRSISKIKNFEGEVGSYSYIENENDRYLKSELYLKQITNGEIVVIE